MYTIVYLRYQAPLYLEQIKPIVNFYNVPKFYVQVCMKAVVLLSTSLIINSISVNSSIFAQKKSFYEKHHHQKLKTF